MRARRRFVALLVVTLAAGLVQTPRAEVSGSHRNDGLVDMLVMGPLGITDGVDPIPQIWKQYRPLPPEWVLNPSGELRGDGRPDVAFHRPSGAPVVVWAYNHGESHDIAISSWEADGWSPVELITNTAPPPFGAGDPGRCSGRRYPTGRPAWRALDWRICGQCRHRPGIGRAPRCSGTAARTRAAR